MTFSPIALTPNQTRNLYTLRDIGQMQGRTQDHLSSGRRINDVTDDVFDYFRARALSDRAEEFKEYKQGIDQAVSLIKTDTDALQNIEEYLKIWKAILNEVLASTATPDIGRRLETLTERFYDSGIQLMVTARDAHYNGVNLIDNGEAHYYVRFSEQRGAYMKLVAKNIIGSSLDTGGILSFRANGRGGKEMIFQYSAFENPLWRQQIEDEKDRFIRLSSFMRLANDNNDPGANLGKFSQLLVDPADGSIRNKSIILDMLELTDNAIRRTRNREKELGLHIGLLHNRINFNSAEVRNYDIGSDKITLADMNEEGAFLVALNTRQQLSVNALAVSGRQQAAVLELFG